MTQHADCLSISAERNKHIILMLLLSLVLHKISATYIETDRGDIYFQQS